MARDSCPYPRGQYYLDFFKTGASIWQSFPFEHKVLPYKNFIIIISSPSGAGKSSIIDEIKKRDEKLSFSISATTRSPRANEVDGENYHFLTGEEFSKKVKNNEFLEYVDVFGNSYGTLRSEITTKFEKGLDVIMDIDWQGNRQISSKMDRSELLRIFILPPSLEELSYRIRKRNLDNEATIERRISGARNEIAHFGEYDHVVINDILDVSVSEVSALIMAKRIENTKKSELDGFVEKLLS